MALALIIFASCTIDNPSFDQALNRLGVLAAVVAAFVLYALMHYMTLVAKT
jgi:xanthine/uracil permease